MMTKEQFQDQVFCIEFQAERAIAEIDGFDRSLIDSIRSFDPGLAALLDRGITDRRAVSQQILDHLRTRREKSGGTR